MNKILIFLISAVFVVVVFAVGVNTIFSPQYSTQNNSLIEELPPITDEELNRILGLVTQNIDQDTKDYYGFSDLNESHLINLVHIVKEDYDYEISCRLGPAYEVANLNKYFPEELVSMGQIRNCDVETAKVIDNAVRSPEVGCRVFTGEIPLLLTDYYFFAVSFKEEEVIQEWIDKLTQKWSDRPEVLKCFEPLKNLIGETVARFGAGVVDLNENIVYF